MCMPTLRELKQAIAIQARAVCYWYNYRQSYSAQTEELNKLKIIIQFKIEIVRSILLIDKCLNL